MKIPDIHNPWRVISKVFLSAISLTCLLLLFAGVYVIGMVQGYKLSSSENSKISAIIERLTAEPSATPTQTAAKVSNSPQNSQPKSWGGPDLWEAVNKRRIEYGVNPLQQRDELCTIASIRLNEQLTLGTLDNHEGFTNMKERRPDLAWIFEKYGTLAEFLAQGGKSAAETVSLWENTLGHKKLMTGGEFVWGCIYAQESFAVAITAY